MKGPNETSRHLHITNFGARNRKQGTFDQRTLYQSRVRKRVELSWNHLVHLNLSHFHAVNLHQKSELVIDAPSYYLETTSSYEVAIFVRASLFLLGLTAYSTKAAYCIEAASFNEHASINEVALFCEALSFSGVPLLSEVLSYREASSFLIPFIIIDVFSFS